LFGRTTYAEIEEIPWEEHIVPVQLSAPERAIYLELDRVLKPLDYNVQKSRVKVDIVFWTRTTIGAQVTQIAPKI
jgi:hypothetical protein